MADTRVVLTYRDYEALPNDGRRYEIHDGELSVTPAPGTAHQRVLVRLVTTVHTHVTARRLGEVFAAPFDVILSNTSIVQPDLVYVASERAPVVSARGVEGAPTLAVEIQTKMPLYARHGVPYYWIVDTDARVIEAYALQTDRYALRARAAGHEPLRAEPLADLTIDTASLWA